MSGGLFGKKRRRGSDDFYLQITSLIDTLVIILVFMLMSLGSSNVNIDVASNIRLPASYQGAELAQALKLVAKTDGIYVEEEKVAPLQNALALAGSTAEDGKKIVPLFQKLSKLALDNQKAAKASGVKFEGKILLQADKSIPLKTIKQVLYTAARAGYNDFKFAVLKQ